ncbi:MAG: 50S ribosomal protein L25/general stress protein Ctc [Coxiellaceae bacterium]|nr:50S ribosomal protein L25/general stress protein Ctc [Coxiellaceae bacterium]
MTQTFTISATARSDMGKGASRRLRRANKVPGIVYGASKAPIGIAVDNEALLQLLEQESSYTKILDLDVGGIKEQVILKDLQRHPFKPRVLHLDLQRISATEKLVIRVPLHFIGGDVAPGVKVAGGLISHLMSDVEVRCLPKDLLEFIEVNLSKLEINQTVHLSDLKLPKEVEIIALIHGEDKPVATAYIPRAIVEEEAAPVAAEVPVAGEEKAESGAEVSEIKAEGADAKGKDKASEKKGK